MERNDQEIVVGWCSEGRIGRIELYMNLFQGLACVLSTVDQRTSESPYQAAALDAGLQEARRSSSKCVTSMILY
jgi:hypothetical protein